MKKLSFFLLLLISTPSFAHPHAWIDMKTTLVGTNTHINKIVMSWQYDPMTSAYNLDGLDTSPENIQQTLSTLSDQIIKNLLNVHYYTYFYQDQTPIRYLETDKANFEYDKKRLTFTFTLTLAQPLPISTPNVSLRIYEPTYYVDMAWKQHNDIQFSKALQNHCSVDIEEATPTSEQMMYAASLPPDVTPDRPLGQLFAQTAHIHCH